MHRQSAGICGIASGAVQLQNWLLANGHNDVVQEMVSICPDASMIVVVHVSKPEQLPG
jgi:hypothetical protein